MVAPKTETTFDFGDASGEPHDVPHISAGKKGILPQSPPFVILAPLAYSNFRSKNANSSHVSRYALAIKLNSTRSTLLKVDTVDRVALAPYTMAIKSTVSATKLNVYGNIRLYCRFVAGFGSSRLFSTKLTMLNSTLSSCTLTYFLWSLP